MRSQCAVWRSVLSDRFFGNRLVQGKGCLNAPFGARCFLTGRDIYHFFSPDGGS